MNGADTGLDEIEILNNLTVVIIPVISFVAVTALKYLRRQIPDRYMPAIGTLLGTLASGIGQGFGITGLDELGLVGGTVAGAAATGFHQWYHQNSGEKLETNKAEEKNVARSVARAKAKESDS